MPPPAADRLGSEAGRIMINPHTDPPLVFGHVVYAIGNRFTQGLVHEIVDAHFSQVRPAAAIRAPAFLKSPTSSFFFVSTEITG